MPDFIIHLEKKKKTEHKTLNVTIFEKILLFAVYSFVFNFTTYY